MALDFSVGGASSNSYLSLTEAQAYWESRLFTDSWDDSDGQEAALMWATRLMDAAFIWTGVAASSSQALGWPRVGMLTRNGFAIAETEIPTDLKNATAELAGSLSAEDITESNEILRLGLTGVKVGPVDLKFKGGTGAQTTSQRNADLMLQSPEFAYASQMIPDSVRILIPGSWYVRALLGLPIFFEAD